MWEVKQGIRSTSKHQKTPQFMLRRLAQSAKIWSSSNTSRSQVNYFQTKHEDSLPHPVTFPAHYHRNNPAEKDMGTFKEHLIASLCSDNPNFPLYLWDRLISQCTTTLNLLRPSNIKPLLSTEAQLNVAIDYKKTPMALLCTKVLVYETPLMRTTFDPPAVDGWYIVHAPKHYGCFRVYIPKTREERSARNVDSPPMTAKYRA